jgi:Ca2+-binding RTX toxin-like protein
MRPQDVIELAPGLTLDDYTVTTDGAVTTMTSSSHQITYVCGEGAPTVKEHSGSEPPVVPVEEVPEVEPPVVPVPVDEIKRGGRGHDNLAGGDGHDRLYGSGGNDVLSGSSGNDRLYGGDGNDKLNGGSGRDWMEGGRGNDRYYVDGTHDVIVEKAGQGTDTVVSAGSYTLGKHVENLALTGLGNSSGKGNGLNNVLRGNAGDNNLSGKDGNDHLFGGAGDDVLTGGRGHDRMHGGSGNDTFVFKSGDGWDRIADFRSGSDKIDVRALNVNHVSDLDLNQIGRDLVIWHGTNVVILEGVALRDLDNSDFIF